MDTSLAGLRKPFAKSTTGLCTIGSWEMPVSLTVERLSERLMRYNELQ